MMVESHRASALLILFGANRRLYQARQANREAATLTLSALTAVTRLPRLPWRRTTPLDELCATGGAWAPVSDSQSHPGGTGPATSDAHPLVVAWRCRSPNTEATCRSRLDIAQALTLKGAGHTPQARTQVRTIRPACLGGNRTRLEMPHACPRACTVRSPRQFDIHIAYSLLSVGRLHARRSRA